MPACTLSKGRNRRTASVVKVFMMAAMQAKLNFARERDSSNRLAEHL